MSIELIKDALDLARGWQKTCLDLGRSSNELMRASEVIDMLQKAIKELKALEAYNVPISDYKRLQELVTHQGIRLMQYESFAEPVAYMGTDGEGNPNKFRLNPFNGAIPLYTVPQTTGDAQTLVEALHVSLMKGQEEANRKEESK